MEKLALNSSLASSQNLKSWAISSKVLRLTILSKILADFSILSPALSSPLKAIDLALLEEAVDPFKMSSTFTYQERTYWMKKKTPMRLK